MTPTREQMLEHIKWLRSSDQHIAAEYGEICVERGMTPKDGDDFVVHEAIVRTVRKNWGSPGSEEIKFPLNCAVAVHMCGSADPMKFIIIALSGCDDGDICIGIGQGDIYQATYLGNSYSRRFPRMLEAAELKVIGLALAEHLRDVEAGKWLETLRADFEAANQFFAQFEYLFRTATGKPSDA